MPLVNIGVIPLGVNEIGSPLRLPRLGVALIDRAVLIELDRGMPCAHSKQTRLELREVDRRGLLCFARAAARLRPRRAATECGGSRHAVSGKQRGLGEPPAGKRTLV